MPDLYAVTFESAVRWLRGEIMDAGLVPGHEVIYWKNLSRIRDYPAGLLRCRELFAAGARGMIVRTHSPIVSRKLTREGLVATLTEVIAPEGVPYQSTRYIAPPAALIAWVQKVRVKSNL